MSKFCEKCGAEMDDNQTVCPNCSKNDETKSESTNTTVTETVTEETTTQTTNNSKLNFNLGDPKKIAIIAGAIAVIVILIGIISSIFGSGWKKPIANYFKGQQKANSKTYLSAFPEFYADNIEKYYEDDDMEEMLDKLKDEYGNNVKISYKIKDKEKIKKDDLQKIQKYIKEANDEEVKVSKGYKVKIEETIKGKEDKDTDTITMYVYKINGKWGIIPGLSPSEAKSYLKNHDSDD